MKSKAITLIILGVVLFNFGCEKQSFDDVSEKSFDAEYFAQNIAILKENLRSIDEDSFVKEILIKDFDGTLPLPEIFGYKNEIYVDDGTFDDECFGDGIYTSINSYLHTNEMPYKPEEHKRTIIHDISLGIDFKHHEKIPFFSTGKNKDEIMLKGAKIICKLVYRPCAEYDNILKGCPACLFKAGCIEPRNCKVEFGF